MSKEKNSELQIQLLLESDLLEAPTDFTERVLREIEFEAPDQTNNALTNNLQEDTSAELIAWWQWLAVAGGSLVGMTQVTRFIFGFWLSAAAG